LAVAALITVAAGVSAQVPPEVAARIRAAGQTMDPSAGLAYAPVYAGKTWTGITAERDLAYGPHALQKLDVYVDRATTATKRPILIFVHGGGFARGDKHGPFYPDNIPQWAAERGMVGIAINYRLAPANPWPAAAQDLTRAIAWTRANAARFGGDPGWIVLFGHSAGANHVADYLGHAEIRGAEAASVRGAILLSPHFAPAAQVGPPFYAAPAPPGSPHPYYGHDAALQSAEGTVIRLRTNRVPLLLADAEFDPPLMLDFSRALVSCLCRSQAGCPRYLYLRDHNHFTEGMSLGTADASLSAPLLDWIRRL